MGNGWHGKNSEDQHCGGLGEGLRDGKDKDMDVAVCLGAAAFQAMREELRSGARTSFDAAHKLEDHLLDDKGAREITLGNGDQVLRLGGPGNFAMTDKDGKPIEIVREIPSEMTDVGKKYELSNGAIYQRPGSFNKTESITYPNGEQVKFRDGALLTSPATGEGSIAQTKVGGGARSSVGDVLPHLEIEIGSSARQAFGGGNDFGAEP